MEQDLKLIRQKIRAANKLPQSNPVEYNLKQDILRHWKGEEYKLKVSIAYDKMHRMVLENTMRR